ncbi:MAG: vitamin B12-dependent ribonucleotide reductase [Myxococcales bacterium]|nr:vitamin B12-dependent ribonucleotide reductase [Myxococcales bacterium]
MLENVPRKGRNGRTTGTVVNDDAEGPLTPRHAKARETRPGLTFERFFTREGDDGYGGITWELRTASITGESGKSIFEQKDIEVPKFWSQTATNVVAQKYFRGQPGTPERERSVRQLIDRVADTVTNWGLADGYFADGASAEVFRAELKHLIVNQKMSFNSPVWFNVGIEAEPQCSACFINSVDDTMGGILTLAKTEGMLFKYGSGTGTNLSPIRSSREFLNGGGTASGPVSFMRGFDAFAGVIKSGGKTRRAAKMVILNVDHPDVEEFIWCKAKEEKKAWALIDAGYDGSFDGEAYKSIFFQNSNNSVRVTDDFMEAVQKDNDWSTRAVLTGAPVDTFKARKLWRAIAQAAWECGDPGLQFDTTVNAWHTSPNSGRINASNPCSEYMYLDDSACNLASLNLRKFQTEQGGFDVDGYKKAIELTITAQEILVDNAKYPTPRIAENSHKYRPLGLGYANLGSLLMSMGLPYDSEEGRAWCGALTSILTGWAYRTSARISRDATGPFEGYAVNEQPFLGVMKKHRYHVDKIDRAFVAGNVWEAARDAWDDAIVIGAEAGFRNGQATVLAPTGTIGFMMDCDTTGIEPDIALIKYKRLVGGGMIKIVNNTIDEALRALGYDHGQRKEIVEYVDREETIEGAPGLDPDHLPVFDCAFRAANGTRSIHYTGHIRMMSAAQPFLSGAISKTVNLPADASVEDVQEAYLESWKAGLKAVAIYRDGCKRTQPLSTSKTDPGLQKAKAKGEAVVLRKKLPDERHSLTHKFSVAGHEGYIHVGLYEDGAPGEIFVRMAKEGSTISGLMDSFATAVSLALQHGVSLRLLVDKFSRTRFEPAGFTGNPEIPRATSLMDYIFRWLEAKFLREDGTIGAPSLNEKADKAAAIVAKPSTPAPKVEVVDATKAPLEKFESRPMFGFIARSEAPTCPECGDIMVPNGSCHKCITCGTTSGCS